MPDGPDADRRPVPHARTTGLAEAPPQQERWTGNWATEHPPTEHPPVRAPRQWSGWIASVLMLAAAGLLFWAPWDHPTSTDMTPLGGATAAAAPTGGGPSDAAAQGQATGGSAAPGQRVVNGPIVPTRISIAALGVNTTVEHRGTVRSKNPFTGKTVSAFGVPSSMRTTSWWSDGPEPGSGQMAVILGHTQIGGYGVFNELGQLRAGQPITLRAANGDTLSLQVVGSPVTGLDKATAALANTLAHHPAGAAVALVTCGGQFDQDAHASEDNVVVFASVVPSA